MYLIKFSLDTIKIFTFYIVNNFRFLLTFFLIMIRKFLSIWMGDLNRKYSEKPYVTDPYTFGLLLWDENPEETYLRPYFTSDVPTR